MKKLTPILCAALIAFPVQQPKAQAGPLFALVVVATVVAGGMAIYISTCGPKYYCCEDPDSKERWCRQLARGEAQAEGWKVISGPYRDAGKCDANCTNDLPVIAKSPVVVHVERSTNIRNWTEVARVTCNPDEFEYSETNAMTQAFFYRAWY